MRCRRVHMLPSPVCWCSPVSVNMVTHETEYNIMLLFEAAKRLFPILIMAGERLEYTVRGCLQGAACQPLLLFWRSGH